MSHTEIAVLIVDDHEVLTDALAVALRDRGFTDVRTAGTVAGALEEVRRHCPDVVLMDFRLPDGEGTKAAAEVRSGCADTKVVMLSAEIHESIVLEAIEAGCSGYLLKSTKLEDVVEAVRMAHEGEALISPAMLARILPKLRSREGGIGSQLSPREMEILRLLSEGRSNQQIAESLVLSINTVRNHVQRVLEKLGAHSKLEAVAIAARGGLLHRPGDD